VHVEPSHGLHEIFFSKTIHCRFWPRPIIGVEFWGHDITQAHTPHLKPKGYVRKTFSPQIKLC
jgi:hypothetical protein